MNDFGRRVNSIIIKNLPTNYTENELEELFSKFGRVVSSKVLPANPNFDGGCGFVNFAEAESCNKAVDNMNNFVIDRFTLRVNHSSTRMNGNNNNGFDRPQNGFRANGESNDENNGPASPSVQNRFSGFRPASARSSTCTTPAKSTESDKPLWNSTNVEQQLNKSPFQNETTPTIREHDLFVTNKIYCVYLSNLEVPNVIFAATLDDYVSATLLITQMNKHEQLTKVQANSYKSKPVVGQCCAALFNGDWYRARILETEENRVRVQYVDWGNTGWCDSILEVRPLPNEYYKDPALCVKCLLDGIQTVEKPSDEQTNAILEILVLDVKLEMTVLRFENGIPYVQLNLGERNLNAEIRALLPQPSPPATTAVASQKSEEKLLDFHSNQPEINPLETHSVQLTTVDSESECFHVLLMRDCLPTIMNVLKDWDASKQPLTTQPKANTLVCAQYEGDDLWYRAWIQSVAETGFRVYFVDFGNEEVVSLSRMSECPNILRNIPWQSVQIKLANIKLTDDERYLLLRDFETDRLDMKVLSKSQDIYSVELINNDKSLTDYMLESRKKKEQESEVKTNDHEINAKETVAQVQRPVPKVDTPPPSTTTKTETVPRTFDEAVRPISLPVQPIVNESKSSAQPNSNQSLPPATTALAKSPNFLSTSIKTSTPNEQNNDNTFNENLTTMITEQRRQNRLLEQVIAAVNTTNALLTQLVQR